MATLSKFTTPQIEIGEYVNVLTGFANNNAVIPDTLGQFVRANNFYNKADYPELFARIGSIGGNSVFTMRSSGTISNLNCITYGNGIFMAGGAGGVLRSSTDGITWTTLTSGTAGEITTVCYGNGTFIFGLGDSTIRSSTDNGATWTTRAVPGGAGPSAKIVYGNGRFLFGYSLYQISTSTNGITWSSQSTGTFRPIGVGYGNGLYVYGTVNGEIFTSTDTSSWTQRASGLNYIWNIDYGNGIYVFSSATNPYPTGSSTDGINWSQTANVFASKVTYTNGRFLYTAYISPNGQIRTSTDAAAIDFNLYGTTSNVNEAVYGNGLYVIVGNGGLIATSTDVSTMVSSPYYDAATQFYVPPYNMNALGLTISSYSGSTNAQYVSYVRAK